MSEKDRAKIDKRQAKDEEATRKALAAHQSRAAHALAGDIPRIMRNK